MNNIIVIKTTLSGNWLSKDGEPERKWISEKRIKDIKIENIYQFVRMKPLQMGKCYIKENIWTFSSFISIT